MNQFKITEEEFAKVSIARLATHPNASSVYGAGKMSEKELKAQFDKQGELFRKKFNEFLDIVSKEGEGSLADKIMTGISESPTLRNLFKDIVSETGDFAKYLSVGDETLSNKLLEIDKKFEEVKKEIGIFPDKADSFVKKTNHGKNGNYALVENGAGTVGAIEVSEKDDGESIALRKKNGAVAVGDAIEEEDAVSLGVLNQNKRNWTTDVYREVGGRMMRTVRGERLLIGDVAACPNSVKLSLESKNMIRFDHSYTVKGSSRVLSGITFTVEDDGSISMRGKHSGTSDFYFYLKKESSEPIVFEEGVYSSSTGQDFAIISVKFTDGTFDFFKSEKIFKRVRSVAMVRLTIKANAIAGRTFNGERLCPIIVRGSTLNGYVEPLAEGEEVTVTYGEKETQAVVGKVNTIIDVGKNDEIYAGDRAVLVTEYPREEGTVFSTPFTEISVGSAAVIGDITPLPNAIRISVESKNLVPAAYHDNRSGNTVTIKGVTLTTNEDGSITLYGTPDENTYISFFLVSSKDNPLVLPKGTYFGSTGVDFATLSYMQLNGTYGNFNGAETLLEETKMQYLYVSMLERNIAGKTFNGETIYPMLMRGTVCEDYTQPVAVGTAATVICGERVIETAVGDSFILADVDRGAIISVSDGAAVVAEYNRDANSVFNELKSEISELRNAIISLGGNV